MPTVEQINEVADLLEELCGDNFPSDVLDADNTRFRATATQLRKVAESRKAKPPKVFVNDYGDGDLAIYVEKPTGKFIGLHVLDSRDGGYALNNDLGPSFAVGEQVWGNVK
ncbi:hypothetical protein [Mycobacteroides salmoniphilum]|uniref:hypothetical protein n=1 Tax=Mycobacteroides salmoniphilum TaxID=404941 RepID=UPI000991AF32|nr:hypothetical protein [Mycobacteroides salmoniphilum]